jgi:protein-disulfide isomerase
VVNRFFGDLEPRLTQRFTEDCRPLKSSVPRKSLFLTLALGLFLCRTAEAQLSGGGVSLAGVGHDIGNASGKVFIVEFADFGCSYCSKFNADQFPKIDSAYIKRNVVRWKMVPFVTGMFRHSRNVAEASECAAEQGEFWKMHDLLYLKRKEWMASTDIGARITQYATQLNLDRTIFARCLLNPETRRRIQRNDVIAQKLGIRGTPTFYVNGRIVPGAITFELFQQVIVAASK